MIFYAFVCLFIVAKKYIGNDNFAKILDTRWASERDKGKERDTRKRIRERERENGMGSKVFSFQKIHTHLYPRAQN